MTALIANQQFLWQPSLWISNLFKRVDRKSVVSLKCWLWISCLPDKAGSDRAECELAVPLTAQTMNQQSLCQCWLWISSLSDSADNDSALPGTALIVNLQYLWHRWLRISSLSNSGDGGSAVLRVLIVDQQSLHKKKRVNCEWTVFSRLLIMNRQSLQQCSLWVSGLFKNTSTNMMALVLTLDF
jgi:hypothetical protein